MHKSIKQMIHTQVFSLIQVLFGFVIIYLLVSDLSPEDYAQYVLIQGFLAISLLLFSQNLYTYTRLHIPGADTACQYAYLKTVLLIVIACYVACVFLVFATNVERSVFNFFEIKSELIILVLLMIGFELISLELQRFFIAIKRINKKNYAATIQKLIVLLGCTYLIFDNFLTIKNFLLVFIIGQIAVVLYLLSNLNLQILSKTHLRSDVITFGYKVAIPLIPIGLISVTMNYVDTLMIRKMVGVIEVANYGFASQVVNIAMMIIGSSVLLTLFPYATEAHNNNEYEERDGIFSKMILYGAVLSLIFYLLMLTFSTWGIENLGLVEYSNVPKILSVMAIYPLASLFYMVNSHRLQLLNIFNIQVYMAILIILLNIVLNYFAIKQYGLFGAVYASLLSYLILSLMYYLASKRASKLKVIGP